MLAPLKKTARRLAVGALRSLDQDLISVQLNGTPCRFPLEYLSARSLLDRKVAYEPEFSRALIAACKPGATVYDVGANIGKMTLQLAVAVGPTGRVVAFEPHPKVHADLQRVCTENGLGHVEVLRAAAGETASTLHFIARSEHFEQQEIFDAADASDPNAASVEVLPIDQLVERTERAPQVIKIDVEGYEHDVLLGMKTTLTQRRPEVFMEIHPGRMGKLGKNDTMVLDLMRDAGYREAELLGESGVNPETGLRYNYQVAFRPA